MTTSLVLLSGGLDSTAVLSQYLNNQRVEVAFIDYGQKHLKQERAASIEVAAWCKTQWHHIDASSVGNGLPSALTSNAEIPDGHYADPSMLATVVPNRNATLFSLAGGLASHLGIEQIVTATHAGDAAVYQDCRPEFISAMSTALKLGCGVTIDAPFIHSTKAEIVEAGVQHGAPLDLSWSCYRGGEAHCGRCGTCVERAEAFHLAGYADPTHYIDETFWRKATCSQ